MKWPRDGCTSGTVTPILQGGLMQANSSPNLCQVCGTEFHPAIFHAHQLYCSKRCQSAAQRANNRLKSAIQPCERCATMFQPNPFKKSNVYCSRTCAARSRYGSLADRFWTNVDMSGECWLWTGRVNASGYGTIGVDGKSVLAHRLSYTLNVGPIPKGKLILHNCNNRPCVRPVHIRPGSHFDNAQDAKAAGSYVRKPRPDHGVTNSSS